MEVIVKSRVYILKERMYRLYVSVDGRRVTIKGETMAECDNIVARYRELDHRDFKLKDKNKYNFVMAVLVGLVLIEFALIGWRILELS